MTNKIPTITSVKKGQKGNEHPAWKGGVSQDKSRYRYQFGYQREYKRRQRNAILEALGGKCSKCGFQDKRALQIDHINGDGARERKIGEYKGGFEKHVLQSFLRGDNVYQLLCANCNWIKRFEKNETRLGQVNNIKK